jgi:hypothetical protein
LLALDHLSRQAVNLVQFRPKSLAHHGSSQIGWHFSGGTWLFVPPDEPSRRADLMVQPVSDREPPCAA